MQPETVAAVRIDKWLWAVRAFKTRSLAIAACNAGHVRIGGQRVKPARCVHVGETVTTQVAGVTRTLRVTGLIERRVGAQAASRFIEDLTPPEEYAKPRESAPAPAFTRPKGAGRPTKRERRLLERMGFTP